MSQGQEFTPYFSSSPQYTMNEREANIIRLLRTFMAANAENPPGRSLKYLMSINELDPQNMYEEDEEGNKTYNTFFDLCCKVRAASFPAACGPQRQSSCALLAAVQILEQACIFSQVLHVQGEGNTKVLYVWDGRDARPLPPG
jgi:hypothetical protein